MNSGTLTIGEAINSIPDIPVEVVADKAEAIARLVGVGMLIGYGIVFLVLLFVGYRDKKRRSRFFD